MLDADDLALIRKLPLFGHMSDDTLAVLLGNAFPKNYPKGYMLFLRNDPADCFYVVLDGWVKIYRETPDGNEAVLGIFTQGECLAEAAAFLGEGYPASAQVVEDARLVPILSAPFCSHITDMPKIAMNMMASMSQRLHHLVTEVEQLKTRSATLRVVDFLLKLCVTDSGAAVVLLPYDKALISQRLGIQPESLSRILARLRQQGVKTEQNRVLIADIETLKAYFSGETAEERKAAS